MITYRIAKSVTNSSAGTFCHPVLSDTEHVETHIFGEIVKGETFTATGFTSSLGLVSNLPISNVVYAYDFTHGTVLLLECNNSIYLVQKCPIHF